jgi:hypothetical protein
MPEYEPLAPEEVWRRAGFDRCVVESCKVWVDRVSSGTDVCKRHRAIEAAKKDKQ